MPTVNVMEWALNDLPSYRPRAPSHIGLSRRMNWRAKGARRPLRTTASHRLRDCAGFDSRPGRPHPRVRLLMAGHHRGGSPTLRVTGVGQSA
jgi:hypothetical protein